MGKRQKCGTFISGVSKSLSRSARLFVFSLTFPVCTVLKSSNVQSSIAHPSGKKRTNEYKEKMVNLLKEHGVQTVLDAACGTGLVLDSLDSLDSLVSLDSLDTLSYFYLVSYNTALMTNLV